MSDSFNPDERNPFSEDDKPQQDPTPTKGIVHDDLGDPEQGLGPPEGSMTGEPGQGTPEHAHERRLKGSGRASPADSGNAPPELSGDDESLLTGNPPGTKPM